MENLQFMKILDALTYLLHKDGSILFLEPPLFLQLLIQMPPRAQLQQNIHIVAIREESVAANEVWMLNEAQYLQFSCELC